RAEREDDVVAAAHVRDAGPDLLDDAGGLVPEHHRQGQGPVAVDDVPVAVADARRHHTHAGLTRLGALLLDVHHVEGGIRLVQDCGLDRKSTRLNSSHEWIWYAVFCLKKTK